MISEDPLDEHIENVMIVIRQMKLVKKDIAEAGEEEAFKRLLSRVGKMMRLTLDAMNHIGLKYEDETTVLDPENLVKLLDLLKKQKIYDQYGI